MSIAKLRIFSIVLAVNSFGVGGLPLASAQEVRQVPQLSVGRLSDGERPVVDGRVGEAIWATAQLFSTFIQQEPDEGQPATERTAEPGFNLCGSATPYLNGSSLTTWHVPQAAV